MDLLPIVFFVANFLDFAVTFRPKPNCKGSFEVCNPEKIPFRPPKPCFGSFEVCNPEEIPSKRGCVWGGRFYEDVLVDDSFSLPTGNGKISWQCNSALRYDPNRE